MRVSVIIPNFNKAKVLRACLEAVYAQRTQPAEVIVVDDASSDRSTEIAGEFPCRLIVQPANRGVSAARNLGAAVATGDVLFFVDSDIALAPDAIANALRELSDHPQCGVVQGIYDARPLVSDGPVEDYKILYEHFWRRRSAGVVDATLFALTAVPRRVFDEVGGFDERLRDAEDVEWGTRLPVGYEIRMSAAVIGRHDDVDRLGPYLAELFRRARTYAASVVDGRRRSPTSGNGPARRGTDLVAVARMVVAAAVLVTAPFALLSPWLLLGPAILAAVGLALDQGPLRYAIGERGPAFGGFFAGMQFLTHLTEFAGMSIGVLSALARGGRPSAATAIGSSS